MPRTAFSATLFALSLSAGYGSSGHYKEVGVSFTPPDPWQYKGSSSGVVPVRVYHPAAGIPSEKVPLLVMLHSYKADPEQAWRDFGFQQVMSLDGKNWIVAVPPGREDNDKNLFWAASGDNCGYCSGDSKPPCGYKKDCGEGGDYYWFAQNDCNGGATVNTDVDFIQKVVEDVDQDPDFQVDLSRVYLFGHSNGAYMVYRMWCDIGSDLFAAAVIYAGAPPEDDSQGPGDTYKCDPTNRAIPVLHIHATGDENVYYEGCGYNDETGAECGKKKHEHSRSYPWSWAGAVASVEFACQFNGCDGSIEADGCSQPPDVCSVERGGRTCLSSSHFPCEAWSKGGESVGQKSIITEKDTHVYRANGPKPVELWKIDGSCHHPGSKSDCPAIPSSWDPDGYEASVKNWLLQFRNDKFSSRFLARR